MLDVDAEAPVALAEVTDVAIRKPGRRSRRPGTSRSSSPWRAIRRPRASFRWPWRGTFTGRGVRVSSPTVGGEPGGDRTTGRRLHRPTVGADTLPGVEERAATVSVFPKPERSISMLEWLHQFVIDAVAGYGYVAIFVLMVLESACVPIPSEVTMLFGGALAAPGFAAEGQELSLWAVGAVGSIGTLVGSWVGLLGRRHRRSPADRPIRTLPADPPARGRSGTRVVRATRRRDRRLRPRPAGVPTPSSPCRRASSGCRSGASRFTRCSAPAVDVRPRLARLRARRPLGDGRECPAAVLVGDRRALRCGRRLVRAPAVDEGSRRVRGSRRREGRPERTADDRSRLAVRVLVL